MTKEEIIRVLKGLDLEKLKDGPTAVIAESWGRPRPIVAVDDGDYLKVSTRGGLFRQTMRIAKSEVFPPVRPQPQSIPELAALVDEVFGLLGGESSPYAADFSTITGGCHVLPPTEWFGDICLAFRKVLDAGAAPDQETRLRMEGVLEQFRQ